jgi:flagellar biosynthetic protein FliP
VRPWLRYAVPLASLAVALILGMVPMAMQGINPIIGYRDMVLLAFGSAYGISETIMKAIPLMLAGLGVALAFRMLVWNIGAEGQLYMGAFGSCLVAYTLPDAPAWALLPAALMMMTSFTRIVIVLSFLRRALTTQNIPPTVAVIGLAIFLTLFTMAPTFSKVNDDAVQPYLAAEIAFPAACDRGIDDMKDFMVRQTRQSDLGFFIDLAKVPMPKTARDIPAHVAIPAFAISEFRTSFEMGCLLFIPFLLIDLVVAGILLSAGMMMLPPSIISLPFKIILFVLVDGWRLLAQSMITSFN